MAAAMVNGQFLTGGTPAPHFSCNVDSSCFKGHRVLLGEGGRRPCPQYMHVLRKRENRFVRGRQLIVGPREST